MLCYVAFMQYGAIGMFHPPGDLNGASSSIFWCPLAGPLPSSSSVGVNVEEVQRKRGQLRRQALLGQLDGRYALFGYVLRGAEVLSRLRPEDLVLRAAVVMSEGQGDCSGENYEGDGGDTHLQAGDAHGKCIWRLNPGD